MSLTSEAGVSDRPQTTRERLNAFAREDRKRMKRSRLDDGAVPQARIDRKEVEWPAEQIADAHDRPGSPYRVVDTLARMRKNGSITKEMRLAGEHFQNDFDRAGLDQLRAADVGRATGGGFIGSAIIGSVAAKESVWRAMIALGGASSPAGACIWSVLGNRDSLNAWAQREGWSGRPIHKSVASGVMVGALGVLEKHYGG